MKKGLLVVSVFALGLAFFAPALEADAGHNWYRQAWRDRVCRYLEKSEIRAWKRFDQDRHYSVTKVQNRIDRQERFGCTPDGTIVQQLVERKQFSTLATALTEAGLVDTFNGSGDFTVFAPTNQAFEKLGAGTISAVLANPTLLGNILGYHVVDPAAVPNAVPSSVAVTLSSAPMLNGETVDIELRNGKLFINDSQVVVTDLKTTNGIVHVIDTVLIP